MQRFSGWSRSFATSGFARYIAPLQGATGSWLWTAHRTTKIVKGIKRYARYCRPFEINTTFEKTSNGPWLANGQQAWRRLVRIALCPGLISMTSDDLDAFRMARVMIELHPDDALARAQRRARRLANDDADGAARWRKIADVIGELQRGRREGEPLN